MDFNVIIPSANPNNLYCCVSELLRNDSEVKPENIVVIDDGARDAEIRLPSEIRWITGIKPFVYSRNCNIGIRETLGDIVLLNDDAILKSRNGISQLVKQSHDYGIVSAATNSVGNPNQHRKNTLTIRPEAVVLAFVCVAIPRSVIDKLGLLDERFVTYGWEDNDYCKRAVNAGIQLGIYDGCYVDHASLPSTFRGLRGAGDIEPGRKIFNQKWKI